MAIIPLYGLFECRELIVATVQQRAPRFFGLGGTDFGESVGVAAVRLWTVCRNDCSPLLRDHI